MKMVRRLRVLGRHGRVRGREGRDPAARAGREARLQWRCRRASWLKDAVVRAAEGRVLDSIPLEDTNTVREIIVTCVAIS